MNLGETVEALAFLRTDAYPQGITIADDLGVHVRCDINSNCPEAIKVRRYISEAGVSLPELIEGYEASIEVPARPATVPPMPEHSGMATIQIAGQNIEVDLTEQIDAQLIRATGNSVAAIERDGRSRIGLGESLYANYKHAVAEARRTRTLPQVQYSKLDMIRYRVLITMDSLSGVYLYMFPHIYEPDSIVHDGARYEISDADKVRIKREMFVVLPVSSAHKILRPYMMDTDGGMFQHYHGNNNGECWGSVRLPQNWDGRLKTLADIAYQLKAAVCTINRDSILNRHPRGMPEINDLFGRSTRLGTEGVMKKKRRTSEPGELDIEPDPFEEPPRRRWGVTRR